MRVTAQISVGMLLGAAGALWHLAVVWLRARSLPRLGASGVLLMAPLGWAGPTLAVLFAARFMPGAAWATLPGLVLARAVSMSRLRRTE